MRSLHLNNKKVTRIVSMFATVDIWFQQQIEDADFPLLLRLNSRETVEGDLFNLAAIFFIEPPCAIPLEISAR